MQFQNGVLKKINFALILYYIIMFNSAVVYAGNPYDDAAGDGGASTQAFDTIGTVLTPVLSSIGALFILIGAVRYAMAHSQEDSPSQQKAAMMIGTGIALVILGVSAKTIASGFSSLVVKNLN